VISNLYVYQLLAGERMREAQEAAARDALARQAAARTPPGGAPAGAVRLWLPWHGLVLWVSLRRR
jgi:hypothetical protein